MWFDVGLLPDAFAAVLLKIAGEYGIKQFFCPLLWNWRYNTKGLPAVWKMIKG